MPLYADPLYNGYGDAVYGDEPSLKQGPRVSRTVGTQYAVAIAGVGCILAPVKDSYNKKAAQSWSYNPKSLFKQGDGAALNPRDLYYWNRLEHGTWDGGETYAAWAPDPTALNRQSNKYLTSVGFDTTNPRKLVHQREIYGAPNYADGAITADGPILWWKLGDPKTSTGVYGGVRDEIGPDTTPGFASGGVLRAPGEGGVLFGYAPGPIANDPTTAARFTGSSAISSAGNDAWIQSTNYLGTVINAPFTSGQTPTKNWAVEAWVRPTTLSQNGGTVASPAGPMMVMVGEEKTTGGTGNYVTEVTADAPVQWFRLNDASAPVANNVTGDTMSEATPQDATATAITYQITGGITTDATNKAVQINAGKYLNRAAFTNFQTFQSTGGTIEAWVKPNTAQPNTEGHIVTMQYCWTIKVKAGGRLWYGTHNATNEIDTLATLSTTGWSHVVVTISAGNPNYTVTVYVNGSQVYTGSDTYIGGGPAGDHMSVGCNSTADNPRYQGGVQDVAFYNTVLSATRIAAHYTAGSGANAGWGFGFGITDGSGGVGNKLTGHFPSAGTEWHDSGYTFATEDIWYHVVMSSDNSNVIKYNVNGVVTANTLTQLTGAGNAVTNVGAMHTPAGGASVAKFSRFFYGKIGQVALYNGPLTTAKALIHYNAGAGLNGSLTAGQTYARFLEAYDGKLWINQKNTNMLYSTDGGATWTKVAMPGGDVTTINAIWLKDTNVYVATATNVYVGGSAGFAAINATTHANVMTGIYYSGQLYVGIGTTLRYIDPTTGTETSLFDTGNFNITFTEAFNGKIWFGGTTTSGRYTRVYTWTNNTLPPSAANGTGAQIQDGTIPYGFIVRTSTVYLNNLILAGTLTGDTTTEGQGTVYYITPGGQFGQLCLLGPLMKDIRGTGFDYGIRSVWGADNKLFIGSNHKVGVALYDFSKGALSNQVETSQYATSTSNIVLAVTYHQGHTLFAQQVDGNIWKESTNKVAVATLDSSEFVELAFLDKLIDGVEGTMTDLLPGQSIEVQLSTDYGVTYSTTGATYDSGNSFNFLTVNKLAKHWRTRLISRRGTDPTKAPETTNWSVRFAPILNSKHEWVMEILMPAVRQSAMGNIITETNAKLINQLWSAHENGTVVDFIDRDGTEYNVLVMEINQLPLTKTPVRSQSQATMVQHDILHLELLEVQRVKSRTGKL